MFFVSSPSEKTKFPIIRPLEKLGKVWSGPVVFHVTK